MRTRTYAAFIFLAGCTRSPDSSQTPPVSSVKVQLPRAQTGGQLVSVAQVHLEAGGAVLLNGAPVKADELTEKLRALRAEAPSVEVHLDAAPDVPYAKVIEALDATHKAGIVDVSFDSPPEKPVEAPQKQH